MREHKVKTSSPYPGIYYIQGRVLFTTQVIVTRELDGAAMDSYGAKAYAPSPQASPSFRD